MKVKGSCTKKGRRTSTRTKPDPTILSNKEQLSHGCAEQDAIARGGVATPFPWKLHEMLEDAAKEGNEWIVSWQPHGMSFIVHKPKIFVEKIMPTYFNQSKFASFQRQLNLYGFSRLTTGKDKGAYYHDCFIRGQVTLCRGMVRQKIKGTKVRRTMAAEGEPDFYKIKRQGGSTPSKTTPEDKRPETPEAALEEMTMDPAPAVSQDAVVPPSPRRVSAVLSSKERAHKLRQERLNAVRDALKQTEIFFKADEPGFQGDKNLPTISLKPIVPSVSPLDSEVDTDDESSGIFTPLQKHRKLIAAMPPLLNPPALLKLEPLRFNTATPTSESVKGGDVLFFEGKPFRYLEHLDSLPPPPPALPVVAEKPKAWAPMAFAPQRDTLQSLMRVDPQALMGAAATFHIRPMP